MLETEIYSVQWQWSCCTMWFVMAASSKRYICISPRLASALDPRVGTSVRELLLSPQKRHASFLGVMA